MAFKQLKKRILRNSLRKEVRLSVESHDGILWDIGLDNTCRVKLLGTNDLLTAKYSRSQQDIPSWLVPGSPVRISRTDGAMNTWSVVGQGSALPEPTGGPLLPPVAVGVDAIISGLEVTAFVVPAMFVSVSTGVFRIGGATFTVADNVIGNLGHLTFGSGIVMDGTVAACMPVAASHGSLSRFDLICIGSDRVVDIVQGSAAEEPIVPSTPSGHLSLAYILVLPGYTKIEPIHISKSHTEPIPSIMHLATTASTMSGGTMVATITVTIQDQYGRPIVGHWGILATIDRGTGFIDAAASVQTVTQYTTSNLGMKRSYTDFTYTRDTSGTESSPVIMFSMIEDEGLRNGQIIIIKDSDGMPMP